MFPRLALVAVTLFLTACGATVTTREARPDRLLAAETAHLGDVKGRHADPAATLAGMARAAGNDPQAIRAAADFALRAGHQVRPRDAAAARGFFASALELGLRFAAVAPAEDPDRFRPANVALLQLITLADRPEDASLPLATPLGPRTLDIQPRCVGEPARSPAFHRLVPAELIRFTGFHQRVTQAGFGVAAVGIHYDPSVPFYQRRGTFTPVTAVPRLVGRDIHVDLSNAKHHLTVAAPGGRAPLAADLTAPIALSLDGLNDLALGLRGLFRVRSQVELAGLYMVEPYDPDRIPVVMVHGLGSSPLIWRNMINELQRDPVIRQRYQFWLVYYPSGVPTTASAFFLRTKIAEIRAQFDPNGTDVASRDLVTFGHSMGGVITRMNAVVIGDRLWRQLSRAPFSQARLEPEDRAKVAARLFWEPIPHLRRSIYFSAPHRGATLADSSLAGLGMRLIRLPADTFRFQKHILAALGDVLTLDANPKILFNSIGSLSPRNPVFLALEGAPFKDDFQFHTVVGDRGRGDTPDSSDGIVGYWSAHLDGAAGELIVPTPHTSFEHPDSVRFSRDALREHLRQSR